VQSLYDLECLFAVTKVKKGKARKTITKFDYADSAFVMLRRPTFDDIRCFELLSLTNQYRHSVFCGNSVCSSYWPCISFGYLE